MTHTAFPPLRHARNRWVQRAAWLLATALIVVCMRSLDWPRVVSVVRTVRLPFLGAGVILNGTILGFWAELWCTVLPVGERVPYPRMFEINAVTSAIMNTVPFFAGHASAVVMLIGTGRVTREGALSLIALDQLGEGLAKVAVFLAVAVLAPIPPWMRAGIALATAGATALLVGLLAIAHSHRWIIGPTSREPAPSRGARLARRARTFVGQWGRGLDALRSWKRGATALGCALAMKGVELLAIIAVQRSFGLVLPLGTSTLVLAALILGTILPLAPGNLGSYEASVFAAYRFAGIPPERAFALALVQHLCFLIPAIGTGWLVLLLRPWVGMPGRTVQAAMRPE